MLSGGGNEDWLRVFEAPVPLSRSDLSWPWEPEPVTKPVPHPRPPKFKVDERTEKRENEARKNRT